MKSQARVHSVKEPVMLKLARHAVAVVVVVAAVSAPVAAQAETVSLNFTHVAVTYTAQDRDGSSAVKPG
jgi:type VI protein secretion system component Hcp